MSSSAADVPRAALPAMDGPPLPEQISRQAVDWLVALEAPQAGPDAYEACRRWRAAHPDHERAWRHIESFGAQLRELNAPLAHGTLVRETEGPRSQRRRAIKALVVVASVGSGTWVMRDALRREWEDLRADHRTATGERRTIALADETRIELDTASAVSIRFDSTQRMVRLLRGQILVSTAADLVLGAAGEPRPFLVTTAEGRLRALGTRFAVRQHAGASQLAVLEGAVQIEPSDAPQTGRIVRAGQQTRFTRTGIEVSRSADAQAAAWAAGMLVARDMPLADVISELARYRRGRIVCDPNAAHLKVSGVYPLDDIDRVLDMLQRTLPIATHGLTPYWVTVSLRGP